VLLSASSGSATGGPAQAGIGGPMNGAGNAAATARDEWVRAHGTVVRAAELGSATTLYYFAR
jgi:hypothetical protein